MYIYIYICTYMYTLYVIYYTILHIHIYIYLSAKFSFTRIHSISFSITYYLLHANICFCSSILTALHYSMPYCSVVALHCITFQHFQLFYSVLLHALICFTMSTYIRPFLFYTSPYSYSCSQSSSLTYGVAIPIPFPIPIPIRIPSSLPFPVSMLFSFVSVHPMISYLMRILGSHIC